MRLSSDDRRSRLSLPALALLAAAAAAPLALPADARADERRFTYVYETTTTPPGKIEYEQWVTWKSHKVNDPAYDRVEFRHEIEFGITDRLQMALYLADWSYSDGDSVKEDRVNYDNSAVEVVYNLLHPSKAPLGLALYGEYKGGPNLHKLEGKILVQKNIDRWMFAYNATVEGAWEQDGDEWETEGELKQTAGVSYQIHPRFTVGAELLHQIAFPHWREQEEHEVYAGPNASFRSGTWWVTVTPLIQLTDLDNKPDFQTRLIAGIDF